MLGSMAESNHDDHHRVLEIRLTFYRRRRRSTTNRSSELADGQIRLRIDRFAVTANNRE